MGKRFIAVTCSHGLHLSGAVRDELGRFIKEFKPQLRVHLGDVWDTTAWRTGARGTEDEGADISDDFDAGANFLRWYEPDIVFIGNHDHRPFRMLGHPTAIIRRAAAACVQEIRALIETELRAEMVPYHILRGWRMIGDTAFGHGYMYGENAVRDTVEMLGRPIVMGHVHTLQTQPGRCIGAPTGYSAGLLADIDSLEYAGQRRATTKWKNGWLYGETTPTKTEIKIHTAHPGVGQHIATALAAGGACDQTRGRDDSGGVRGRNQRRPQSCPHGDTGRAKSRPARTA